MLTVKSLTVKRPRVKRSSSSSGFIYDASAHLSANYLAEVLNEVQVKPIFEFYLVQDRKGVEDSGGYLKGPYRKVIELVKINKYQVVNVNIVRGAVLKLKRGVDANGEELSQHFT